LKLNLYFVNSHIHDSLTDVKAYLGILQLELHVDPSTPAVDGGASGWSKVRRRFASLLSPRERQMHAKAAPEPTGILLPGDRDLWGVWHLDAWGGLAPESSGLTREEASNLSDISHIGLPGTSCRTIAVSIPIPSSQEELDEMVLSQLGRRGLDGDGSGVHRATYISRVGDRAIISIDLLEKDLPAELSSHRVEDFAPALRYYLLPEGAVVIMREHGNTVLALGHQGHLAHAHVLGSETTSQEQIAQEVVTTLLSLDSVGLTAGVNSIVLVGAFSSEEASYLTRRTGMPTTVERPSPPHLYRPPEGRSLLPVSVEEARQSVGRMRRIRSFLLLGLGLYMAFLVGLLIYAKAMNLRKGTLTRQQAQTAPVAAEVRGLAERWKAFQPVISYRKFPVYVLAEVNRILPASGLVVLEFESSASGIKMKGTAKDTQAAFGLLESLKGSPNLSSYNWSMPQPQVDQDNTASFHIHGTSR